MSNNPNFKCTRIRADAVIIMKNLRRPGTRIYHFEPGEGKRTFELNETTVAETGKRVWNIVELK